MLSLQLFPTEFIQRIEQFAILKQWMYAVCGKQYILLTCFTVDTDVLPAKEKRSKKERKRNKLQHTDQYIQMTNSGAWLKKIARFFTWTSSSFYFRSLYLAIKKILSNDFAYGLLEDLTFFLYFLKKKRKKERKKSAGLYTLLPWNIHFVLKVLFCGKSP